MSDDLTLIDTMAYLPLRVGPATARMARAVLSAGMEHTRECVARMFGSPTANTGGALDESAP